MRFFSVLKADQESEAGTPPTTEMMAAMGNFVEEATKAGILLATEGLQPTAKGARVSLTNGKLTVTNGPLPLSEGPVCAYALLNVASREEAVDVTRQFLELLGGGECELYQVFEMDDFGAEFTPELREQEEQTRAELAARSS